MESMITDLQILVDNFQDQIKKVDQSCTEEFVEGDPKRKPISFYKEMISDVFSVLSNKNSQLKCFASLLEESDIEALEKYQKFLIPDDSFDTFFHTNLSYLTLVNK